MVVSTLLTPVPVRARVTLNVVVPIPPSRGGAVETPTPVLLSVASARKLVNAVVRELAAPAVIAPEGLMLVARVLSAASRDTSPLFESCEMAASSRV